MNKKKVLIITYYWPPAGGPGVQRWLKFTKYLPEFNIEPIVFIPENPSYPIVDESLKSEVSADLNLIRTNIWEPYQIAELLNPKSKAYKAGHFEKSANQSFLTKLSVFIRGNFFIPDARVFWVKPSVKFLSNYLHQNKIDTLITTGPPHSLHLIGLKLKENFPELKWLADFRDPWTQISYHSELKLTKSSQKKHKKLEEKVMKSADLIIATSFTDAENYKKIGANKVEVVTNGFETSDFDLTKKNQNSSKFKLTYSGGLEVARNPLVLWKIIDELQEEHSSFKEDLELEFYGNLSEDVKNSLKENHLEQFLNEHGYVSHKQSIEGILNSNLLLITNFPDEKSKGIIPGKLFEYMATENRILAIGPDAGDVKKLLEETETGEYFTYEEFNEIKSYILEVYEQWKTGAQRHPNLSYHKYSRKALTERLAQLI